VPKKKAAIGDILEIKTPSGLAYLQYTHDERSMGSLVRVLPGLYRNRPKDFANLSQQKELYFTFYPLEYALHDGETEVVSHQRIPDWAKSYPMMRHPNGGNAMGRRDSWTILRADTPLTLDDLTKAPKYKELTPELKRLSIYSLWPHGFLVKQLSRGWTPERDEEFRLKEAEEREAEKPLTPESKVASNQSVRHYLYFPEKANAEKAAQWFRSQGFAVDVRLGADKENWLALVKHEIVENQEDMEKLHEEMEALAKRLNGEYDGWEVAV